MESWDVSPAALCERKQRIAAAMSSDGKNRTPASPTKREDTTPKISELQRPRRDEKWRVVLRIPRPQADQTELLRDAEGRVVLCAMVQSPSPWRNSNRHQDVSSLAVVAEQAVRAERFDLSAPKHCKQLSGAKGAAVGGCAGPGHSVVLQQL